MLCPADHILLSVPVPVSNSVLSSPSEWLPAFLRRAQPLCRMIHCSNVFCWYLILTFSLEDTSFQNICTILLSHWRRATSRRLPFVFLWEPRVRNYAAISLRWYYAAIIYKSFAVRFLTWTFRNVLCVRVGKLIVRWWRSQHSRTVVWGGSRWDGSWKTPAGAGATPTAAAGTADTPRRYANRT